MDTRNLTLMTDLYQLTMMQGYFKSQNHQTVIFDVFYRSNPSGSAYSIMAGLEQVIEYIKALSFSPEDIQYLKSTGIFEDDFLEFLKKIQIFRKYLCNSRRKCYFSQRASNKSNRSYYGSTVD